MTPLITTSTPQEAIELILIHLCECLRASFHPNTKLLIEMLEALKAGQLEKLSFHLEIQIDV